MQIGPIKYKKTEEWTLVISLILGMFFGLPLGILLNYGLGFPIIPKQTPSDLLGWFIMSFTLPMGLCSLWWVLTLIFAVLFYKKKNLLKSRYALGKILLFWLLFPVMFIYGALIHSILIVPIAYSLSSLDPLVGFGVLRLIGFSIMIPFIILFMAIISPDVRKRIKRQLRLT